jgi:hypothetical protein
MQLGAADLGGAAAACDDSKLFFSRATPSTEALPGERLFTVTSDFDRAGYPPSQVSAEQLDYLKSRGMVDLDGERIHLRKGLGLHELQAALMSEQ